MAEYTSPDNNDTDSYLAFADISQYVTALVLYPIVSLAGITGSALCIAVLSQRQMLTSTNVYLIALAVADLVKLANDFLYFPATLLQMSGSRTGGLVFAHLYPYAFFLSQYTSGVAAWLTVIVAGERCLMVTHPNWSRYSLTVRKSRILSAITYAMLMVITAPYLLRYETVCVQMAVNNSTTDLTTENNCTWMPKPSRLWSESGFASYSKYYVQCQSCLKSLIPLLILIVLNIRIVMAVRETRANKKLASRNRVTIMLAMVILCYIVFTTPDSALSAMGWGYTEVTTNLKRGIREISDLLLAVNSSVNFFLYVAFNRVFRQNLLALCQCRSLAPKLTTCGAGTGGAGLNHHHHHHHHHHHDDAVSRCAAATVPAAVPEVTNNTAGDCCEQRTQTTRLTVSTNTAQNPSPSGEQLAAGTHCNASEFDNSNCRWNRRNYRGRGSELELTTESASLLLLAENGNGLLVGYHGNNNNNNNNNHNSYHSSNGDCRPLNGLQEDSHDGDDVSIDDAQGQISNLLEVTIFVHKTPACNEDAGCDEEQKLELDEGEFQEFDSGHV